MRVNLSAETGVLSAEGAWELSPGWSVAEPWVVKKMRRSSEGAEESGRRDHKDSLGISIAPAIVCDSGFVSSAPSERCAY